MRAVAVLMCCLGLLALTQPAKASRANHDLCLEAIGTAEQRHRMPKGLLAAIALTESGHRPSGTKRFVPWPWTINSPAGSFYLGSRGEAVRKVQELKQAGHSNIDVGCMQINLYHHPDAFRSLDAAFDPTTNVNYGARFLSDLRRRSPTLFDAVGRYHSGTPKLGKAYARRVLARWQGAKDLDLPARQETRRSYTLTPSWRAREPRTSSGVLQLYSRALEPTRPTRPHWYRLRSEQETVETPLAPAPGQIRIR